MTDRRRANRFVLPRSGEATLRLMQDVLVERVSADGLELLTDTPLKPGEPVVVELPSGHGARTAVSVTVQSTAVVIVGDLWKHRALMRACTALPPGAAHGGRNTYDRTAVKRHLPAMGVVIRQVPVHVRDVSTSGCRLDSLEPLPDGCVALLELLHDDVRQTEAVRICRTARATGSPWPWRAGAHFLSLSAPPEASVRNIVARFEIIDELHLAGGRSRSR